MVNLLIAAVIAVGGWWVLRQFAVVSSVKQSSLLIRKLGGMGCIALAGFLTLRGGIAMAAPLFIFGLGLMGMSVPLPWRQKSKGQRSQVRTSVLAMELDHDSGRMEGEVIAGPLRGRKLSSLSEIELVSLESFCATARDQSLALFQAWLDKARPGWREKAQQARSRPQSSGKMDKEEALAVLGLKPGASTDEIRAAHRRLMKDFHPDKGGTDYLAAKINAAKDRALQD